MKYKTELHRKAGIMHKMSSTVLCLSKFLTVGHDDGFSLKNDRLFLSKNNYKTQTVICPRINTTCIVYSWK